MSSIMSMSSMVSSSLLMKVELLEPVSMALSSEVCELERGKNRKDHSQTNQTMGAFPRWPPQRQRSSSCNILWHSNPGYPAGQDFATKPDAAPITLQWAVWKTQIHRSSPHFSFPSLLPDLPSKLLTSCDNFYFPYSTPVEEKRSNARSKGLGKKKQRDEIGAKCSRVSHLLALKAPERPNCDLRISPHAPGMPSFPSSYIQSPLES